METTKKEFKGTEGPWKLCKSQLEHCDYGISDSRGFAMVAHIPNTGDESKNAKLIAAAPKLLEALQQLVIYKDEILSHLNFCREGLEDDYEWMFELGESAISSVLGE